MFEETFGYLIMEIEEKAELFMETGAKLGKARNEMRQSIELANALSEKFNYVNNSPIHIFPCTFYLYTF